MLQKPILPLVRPANDIQYRLASFLFDDLERALQRRRKLLRVIDLLVVFVFGLFFFIF
jgi:hypothetical protein